MSFSPRQLAALVVATSFAAGLNVYATLATLGLLARAGIVALPPSLDVLTSWWVIAASVALYLVEFVADKIPWFDSVWDAIHTVVRPIGGALIAVNAMGASTPTSTALAALLGGTVAMTTHVTKASTRAAVNVSPEPLSNWFLSLTEDVIAIAVSYVALQHPIVASAVAIALLVAIISTAWLIVRWARRRERSASL